MLRRWFQNRLIPSMPHLRGHHNIVEPVRFSPDGKRLVSADWSWAIKIWDVSGRARPLTLAQTSGPQAVAISPDGRIVAGVGSSITLWDPESGQEIATLNPPRDERISDALAFSPDGEHIASGGMDGKSWIWDLGNGRTVFELVGHAGKVVGLAYNRDGTNVATAGEDHTVRIWEAATGRELLVLRGQYPDIVCARVAFQPRQRSCRVGRHGRHDLRLWDALDRA